MTLAAGSLVYNIAAPAYHPVASQVSHLAVFQVVRRGGGQGVRPGMRRVVSGLLSEATTPGNELLLAGVVVLLVVLIVLVALTIREFALLRRS
jgi:hypothetical protein